MNNKLNAGLLAVLVIALLLASGCVQETDTGDKGTEPPIEGTNGAAGETKPPSVWRNTELKDVATGQTFKISDFAGKPVLIESFAVWCPTCLQQQFKIKELKENEGDAIVHVSLDTDPNEDEAKVREHITRNNLDWYFAVSPFDMTQDLIDEFGLTFVSAPSAPVVLVCPDQSARLLRTGVKSADELKSEIEKGC